VIEDGDRYRVIADAAVKMHQWPRVPSSRVARFSVAGEIDTVDAGIGPLGDGRWPAARIGEDFRLSDGLPGRAHTHAQEAFFVVMETTFSPWACSVVMRPRCFHFGPPRKN